MQPNELTRKQNHRRFAAAPNFVLAVALLLTAGATAFVSEAARSRDRLRFDALVRQTNTTIVARLDTYISVLRGGSGLFAADTDVHANEFRAYVERLGLEEHYPGTLAVGFSRRVTSDSELAAIVAQGRSESRPDFQVHPAPPVQGGWDTILFLEPQTQRNRTAFGYNMFSEATRRSAMSQARDTGQPVATGKVELVQEIDPVKQPGFLIYLPVYQTNPDAAIPSTIDARRRALFGYVYCPFRAGDLMEAVLGGSAAERRVVLSIYDGVEPKPEHFLYRSHHSTLKRVMGAQELKASVRLTIAGRPWTVLYEPSDGFSEDETPLAPYALGAGLIISLLFFSVARGQARARVAAEDTAAQLGAAQAELRENESRQRAFFRDVLASVTEGRLRLCTYPEELPARPQKGSGIEITLDAAADLRSFRMAVREAARTIELTDERAQELLTAAGEAAMNAVVHAGGGIATISVQKGNSVQVWVEDKGRGIDVRHLPQATLERGYTTAGTLGHGFFLMLQTVDRVYLLTGPKGTIIVLEQSEIPEEPAWLASRSSKRAEASKRA